MGKTLNVRLPDAAYQLLKASAASHHRSLNDEIIASIEGPLFSKDDVELAGSYLATLRAILELQAVIPTQDDVDQVGRYVADLRKVAELQAVVPAEEDVDRLAVYIADLRALAVAS